tara:strand:- start:231 stop:890 length:660 start_codon:yes stop_codon:yes gene_type:complete
MINSSTDAYQAALKIMSHDYANKYANYWQKKQKVIKTGKANFKDAGRQKTYNAEFAAIAEWKHKSKENMLSDKFKRLDWKGTQKFFKKVVKSKTYQDLCIKTDASRSGVRNPTLELAHFRGRTAGQATSYGAMRLQETNCPYTIIHEFAHLCGNMHHDIGFRRDVIKLSSRFFGVEFAKILKGQFKKNKLKVTVSQHIMTPEKWIDSVMRMEKIREERI